MTCSISVPSSTLTRCSRGDTEGVWLFFIKNQKKSNRTEQATSGPVWSQLAFKQSCTPSSACLTLLVWSGGAEGWLRAAPCHVACGPLLRWVHSAPGHKALIAAGIMQRHARRLSPLAPSILHTLPLKTGLKPNEAFLHVGIGCIWMQRRRCTWSGTKVRTKQGFCFTGREPSLTRASHLPYGANVVVKIYNCQRRWGGGYLQSVTALETSVYRAVSVNVEALGITDSR